jgi:GNAT superfamily N-acetyltransferase
VRRLTEIALAATRYWEYPEDWIERWRDELTHRPETLATQDVLVAEVAGEIIAVCSVSIETDEAELEGLWVLPARIGRGVGRSPGRGLLPSPGRAADRRGDVATGRACTAAADPGSRRIAAAGLETVMVIWARIATS